MTSRQRTTKTFSFEQTDRPPIDLMESNVWPALRSYFYNKYDFSNDEQILTHMHADFRWLYTGSPEKMNKHEFDADGADEAGSYTDDVERPLTNAHSAGDVIKMFSPDASQTVVADFEGAKARWPEFPFILVPYWMPIFSGACEAFGMQEAMVKMHLEREVFKAYAQIQSDYSVGVFKKNVEAGARDYCDYAWIGDDFAGETGLLLSPDMWRELIKPYLKKTIRYLKDAGFKVLFHSCGAVREVIPDLIDMGVDALLVIQTSAQGMVVEELAQHYGGKIVFFGAIDAQHLLTFGSPDDIRKEVIRNYRAFENCGGYVVANSHTCMADIKGENIDEMSTAAFGLPGIAR
ncbi:MAG: hypothetical protein HN948_06190 [Clostridia bacterium]|nr:hypothetical protein [Clostridia bacterium]